MEIMYAKNAKELVAGLNKYDSLSAAVVFATVKPLKIMIRLKEISDSKQLAKCLLSQHMQI